jgi:hypothetical protein
MQPIIESDEIEKKNLVEWIQKSQRTQRTV